MKTHTHTNKKKLKKKNQLELYSGCFSFCHATSCIWSIPTQYLIRNSDGVLEFSYDYFNGSFYTRYVLDSLGMLKWFVWEKEKNSWFTAWSGPDTECDLYGRCGPNGRCSMSSSPIYNCLKGFEPKYSGEWNSGSWSGGCVRSKQLECEKNGNGSWKRDGFLKMENLIYLFLGLMEVWPSVRTSVRRTAPV